MKFTPLTNTWFIGLFNLLCQYVGRGNWKTGARMCAFIIDTDKATSRQKFEVPKCLATRPLLLKLKGKALFSFHAAIGWKSRATFLTNQEKSYLLKHSRALRQLWLARLNTFILILEKHSDKTRWTGFHTIYNYNLGKNKDEATRKPRRAIFPSLLWGGGGSKFVIYFVQYCTELHTESPHDCIIINNHEPGFVSGSGVRGGFINDGL